MQGQQYGSPFPTTPGQGPSAQGGGFLQPDEKLPDHIDILADFIAKKESDSQPLVSGQPGSTKTKIPPRDSLIRIAWGLVPITAAVVCNWLGSTAFTTNLVVGGLLTAFFLFRKKNTDWDAFTTEDLKVAQFNMPLSVYLPYCASALVSFGLLFFYFRFMAWGPAILRVQIPTDIKFIRALLWVIFFAGLHILALLEVYFYSYVLFLKLHQSQAHQIACAALYGLYHFVWIHKALDGFFWILFVTLFMFGLSWVLLVAVRRECFLKAAAMRLGITTGITCALIFLLLSTDAVGAAQGNRSPDFFVTMG